MSKLTAEQALEILQEALRRYQDAGGSVRIATMSDAGERYTAIMLDGVVYHDGDLVEVKDEGDRNNI